MSKFRKPKEPEKKFLRNSISPSQTYELTIEQYENPGYIESTLGTVRHFWAKDLVIAKVDRNYSSFPYLWVEDHPNGNNYLVCGSNYQGQTIIELNTGKRKDFLSENADKGFGFCWSSYWFDPQNQVLVVLGCYWACPYEYKVFDFSNPLEGFPEIPSEEGIEEAAEFYPKFNDDGTITFYVSRYIKEDINDPDYDDEGPEYEIVGYQTFKIEDKKLVLIDSWLSLDEKERRYQQEQARERYEQKLRDFKERDPLYLRFSELIKNPIFDLENSEWWGITHKDWCPTFSGIETRYSRKIHKNFNISIEWGIETAPVKLILGNKPVIFYNHSVEGIEGAISDAIEYMEMIDV